MTDVCKTETRMMTKPSLRIEPVDSDGKSAEEQTPTPTIQKDAMSWNEERLARDRERARTRRERERKSIEVMTSKFNELHSLNKNLREKNQDLIKILARYGVVYTDVIPPTVVTNHATNVPYALSPRDLHQMQQEHASLLHRDGTRIRADVGHNIYSYPIQNTASPIWPSSLHDRMSLNDGPIQQTMRDPKQEQRHVRKEAVSASMQLDMTHPSSARVMRKFNQTRDENKDNNGSCQSYLRNNTFNTQDLFTEQRKEVQQTTPALEGAEQSCPTNVSNLLTNADDSARHLQYVP